MFLTMISMVSSFFITEPVQQDSIIVFAYWKNHEIQQYETLRKTEKYNEDGSVTVDSMRSIDQVEVIDSTADTYILKWIPQDRNYTDSGLFARTSKIPNLMQNKLPVIYETTTNGNFIKLLNKEELSKYYIAFMTSILDSLSTQEEKDSARKFIEPLISDNFIDNALSSQFRQIHQFYDYKYELNSEVEYETTIPNYLIGEAILAKGTLYISDIDTNFYSIEFTDIIEPDSVAYKSSIRNYMQQMKNTIDLGNIDDKIKAFEKANIEMITEKRYNYNIYNGWLNYYYIEESSYVNGELKKRVITYMQIL